jgi:hypothetical protein
MIGNAHIIVALVAGLSAGLVFFLAGRRMLRRRPEADAMEAPQPTAALQPRRVVNQNNLSPEAQAFIKALQTNAAPPAPEPSTDPIWAVDIWDTRHAPGEARGLPH